MAATDPGAVKSLWASIGLPQELGDFRANPTGLHAGPNGEEGGRRLNELLVGIARHLHSLRADVTAASTNYENLALQLQQTNANISSVQSQVGTLSSSIEGVGERLTGLQVEIRDVRDQSQANESQLSTMGTQLATLAEAKADDEAAIAEIRDRLDASSAELESLSTSFDEKITGVHSKCSDLDKDIVAVNMTVKAESKRIEEQVASIGALASSLKTLPDELAEARQDIARQSSHLSVQRAGLHAALQHIVAESSTADFFSGLQESTELHSEGPEYDKLVGQATEASGNLMRHIEQNMQVALSVQLKDSDVSVILPDSDDSLVRKRVGILLAERRRLADVDRKCTTLSEDLATDREKTAKAILKAQTDLGVELHKTNEALDAAKAEMTTKEMHSKLTTTVEDIVKDVFSANDNAKTSAKESREAMRLIYELSQKVGPEAMEENERKLKKIEAELQAHATEMIKQQHLQDGLEQLEKKRKQAVDSEISEAEEKTNRRIAMLSERVNDLVTLRDQGKGQVDAILDQLKDDKAELKEQIHQVGVACNGKADKEWVEEFQNQLKRLLEEEDNTNTSDNTQAKPTKKSVSRREFNRKVGQLQSAIDQAAQSGQNTSDTLIHPTMPGSAAFRCIACDAPLGAPLPPTDASEAAKALFATSNRAPRAAGIAYSEMPTGFTEFNAPGMDLSTMHTSTGLGGSPPAELLGPTLPGGGD